MLSLGQMEGGIEKMLEILGPDKAKAVLIEMQKDPAFQYLEPLMNEKERKRFQTMFTEYL